jgi:hypothetical protein
MLSPMATTVTEDGAVGLSSQPDAAASATLAASRTVKMRREIIPQCNLRS